METEDNNLIDYSAYGTITTGASTLVSGLGLSYNGYSTSWEPQSIKNTQENYLVIPPVLDKVLKKTIDGLSNVRIVEHEVVKGFLIDGDLRFIIHLELVFKWNSKIGMSRDILSDKINDTFKVMYHNFDNYKFSVKEIVIEERDGYKEFIEFFSR